jgi:dTDP-4-amino-4,6-dideoxygalactose transaminase
LIAAALTLKTRAIFVVHYAGVPCDMDRINQLASTHGLLVLEDAAQALLSKYRGRPAGRLGDMAAISFHETKNIQCGEGGAFITDNDELMARAEIIREKGTNRSAFFRGDVDKYTWVDIGSSYLPSELSAAFLSVQLESAERLTAARLQHWQAYHDALLPLEEADLLRRPIIPGHCWHNGHIYYVLLPSLDQRTAFMQSLRAKGIQTTFHYVPLHSAPAGQKYGRAVGSMAVTSDSSDRLVRLPLWSQMNDEGDRVVAAIFEFFGVAR